MKISGKAPLEIDVIISIEDYQPATDNQHEMIDYVVYVEGSEGELKFLQDELRSRHDAYLTESAFEIARAENEARHIEQAEHKYEAQKEEVR